MLHNLPEKDFWNSKYQSGETGWDIGEVSRPLKVYIDTLENINLRILIPGGGNSYEAQYLAEKGFENITVLDISDIVTDSLKVKFKDYPSIRILSGDFFEHQGNYDLILEQTFFCALNPELRKAYAKQIHKLLDKGGILAGVLFNCEFEKEGPPFGGNANEYQDYFSDTFEFLHFEACYHSIPPRMGKELFIEFKKINE